MLDSILDAVKGDLGKVSSVLSSVQQLIAHFETDLALDPSKKDAAIDAVIQLLQSKKSSLTSAAPNQN